MHYSAKQRSKALQSKLAHLIDDQGIHLVEHDASDAASLMMELNPLHFSTAHPTEAILESASGLQCSQRQATDEMASSGHSLCSELINIFIQSNAPKWHYQFFHLHICHLLHQPKLF